jgi:hypothetical protein
LDVFNKICPNDSSQIGKDNNLTSPDGENDSRGFRFARTQSILMNESLKLPDTGQTNSYTSTFGEDSDYLINPVGSQNTIGTENCIFSS